MDVHIQHHGQLFLIDDDPHVLAALEFAFGMDGYDVVTLSSGEALLAHPPCAERACIVIDQRLPGLSGLDTLARLRQKGVDTPAILVTTHPSASVRRRASELALEIVEKPLIGDALSRQVVTLMSKADAACETGCMG